MNYTIGDTPQIIDKPVSIRGDFAWAIEFLDVSSSVETPSDLTGCTFNFVIFELDGVTEKKMLEVGSGIAVADNEVTVSMDNADFSDWTANCKYPYYLTFTNADGFTKCLFEGKFIPTKS